MKMVKYKKFVAKYQAAAKLDKIKLLADNNWLSVEFTDEYGLMAKEAIEIYRQYLSFIPKPDDKITNAVAHCYLSLLKSQASHYTLEKMEPLITEAEEFIIEVHHSIIQAEFYGLMCFVMINFSQYIKAEQYGKIAHKLIGKQKLTNNLKSFYSNYGLALIYNANYQSAQEILSIGLAVNNDADRMISEKLHMHLGLLYRNQQDFQHALDEFLIACQLHSSDDVSGTVILSINIASIYTYTGEYAKVLEILQKNFAIAAENELDKSARDNFLQSFNMYIGCAITIQDFDSSHQGLELMEHYLIKYSNNTMLEDFYRLAADEACALQDNAKALFIYEKALNIHDERYPLTIFFQQSFVNFLIHIQKYERALQVSDLILSRLNIEKPDNALIMTYKDRVQVLKGLNKFEDALNLLEKINALEAENTNHDIKKQVEKLIEKNKAQRKQLQEKEKRISLFTQSFVQEHDINFIGTSAAIKTVIEKAAIAAQHPSINVLISGESGTGKELIAKYIHYSSQVDKTVLQEVNCSAIPDSMLESEFFGYKKGAFTGAMQDNQGFISAAHNGTLFLDEIGDLPLNLQPKLLKVLEEKKITPLGSNTATKVNFRLISATNQNLQEMVKEKSFRADLFNRINSLIIEIPPLRNRTADIIPLADHFLNNFTQEFNLVKPEIDPESKELLLSYHYPGNTRELRNIIERTMIFVRQDNTFKDALRDYGFISPNTPVTSSLNTEEIVFQSATLKIDQVEKQLVIKALKITGNRKSKAAVLLDITPSSLSRRLKKFSLSL